MGPPDPFHDACFPRRLCRQMVSVTGLSGGATGYMNDSGKSRLVDGRYIKLSLAVARGIRSLLLVGAEACPEHREGPMQDGSLMRCCCPGSADADQRHRCPSPSRAGWETSRQA